MNPGILTPPTQFATMPRGLLGRPTPVPMIDARRVFDPDAERYIAAVERADGMPLEEAVRVAIGEFVIGCKADGIWSAIRASCILMGARTLSGALVPLAGTAPTNNNFVSGDYARKTGFLGNGSTKYLSSGRANNVDGQNDRHLATYVTQAQNITIANCCYIGTPVESGGSWTFHGNNNYTFRLAQSSSVVVSPGTPSGLFAVTRSASSAIEYRINGTTTQASSSSVSPSSSTIDVFRGAGLNPSNGRLAFYSIGSSLTLSLLDTRVSNLYTAIGNAIA